MFSEHNGRRVSIEGGGAARNFQIEEIPKHHNGFASGAHSSTREPIIEHPDDGNSRGDFQ